MQISCAVVSSLKPHKSVKKPFLDQLNNAKKQMSKQPPGITASQCSFPNTIYFSCL